MLEIVFASKNNNQEYIEVDDFVRQGEYKYTYSDNSLTALKSEQADLVVSAVERFAQQIPLNLQEIFIWYFEQKGVDNPERFLNAEVNENGEQPSFPRSGVNMQGGGNVANPENQLSNLPPQNLPQPQQNLSPTDMETILNLVKLVYKYASENGGKTSELEKLIESMEQITEE